MMRDLWVVLRDVSTAPSGWTNTIKVIHESEEKARAAAAVLAQQTGGRFFVFRAVAAVKPAEQPVEWEAWG